MKKGNAGVSQKKNSIFSVLARIKEEKVPASKALVQIIQKKKTAENKPYYLLSLPKDAFIDDMKTHGCSILEHHISVYDHYRDNQFGLSAYHYTATIVLKGKRCYLHGYFDSYGVLQNILLQNSNNKTIQCAEAMEALFKNMSIDFTIEHITEIFNIIEDLEMLYAKELHTLNQEIDRLSRLYFNTTADRASTHRQYIQQMKNYIKVRTACNEISFEPDHGTIKLLQETISTFRLPPIEVERIPAEPVTTAACTQPAPVLVEQSPSPEVKIEKPKQPKPVTTNASETAVNRIPDEVQKMLDQIDALINGRPTASSICHLNTLLLACLSQLCTFPANQAMDLCIMQNRTLAKAKDLIKTAVSHDDIDSVRMLLPLIKTVTQELIEKAALAGSVNVLSFLLSKYRGPKRLLRKLDIEAILGHALPPGYVYNVHFELITDDNLPNASLPPLLNFGCNPNATNLQSRSLLFRAIDMRNLARVCILLDAGANINAQQSKTKVHIESQFKSASDKRKILSTVKSRFENTANPLEDSRETPVMIAAKLGCLDIVRCLVQRGCDLSIVDKSGFTLLSHGLISSDMKGDDYVPIKEDIVKYLIEDCKLDIHAQQGLRGSQQTALHFAVQYHSLENARILLLYGADPNVCRLNSDPSQRMSSFFLACVRGQFEIVRLMLTQSKIPVSAEEIEKIINAVDNEKNSNKLILLLKLLNTAPYLTIKIATLDNGEEVPAVEYLHDVADKIRAGLPPEVSDEEDDQQNSTAADAEETVDEHIDGLGMH